jgi:hypothetical protein
MGLAVHCVDSHEFGETTGVRFFRRLPQHPDQHELPVMPIQTDVPYLYWESCNRHWSDKAQFRPRKRGGGRPETCTTEVGDNPTARIHAGSTATSRVEAATKSGHSTAALKRGPMKLRRRETSKWLRPMKPTQISGAAHPRNEYHSVRTEELDVRGVGRFDLTH